MDYRDLVKPATFAGDAYFHELTTHMYPLRVIMMILGVPEEDEVRMLKMAPSSSMSGSGTSCGVKTRGAVCTMANDVLGSAVIVPATAAAAPTRAP